jgi:hypothetical protein
VNQQTSKNKHQGSKISSTKMDKFIRNNFLAICITAAISFAFVKKATVFQKEKDTPTPPVETLKPTPEFQKYWYAGKAEVNSYDLVQARYGNINKGEVVLVFVTEDFRTDSQVKLESNEKDVATSVMKLNFIRKFNTGIYDYSMMSSIFTPVNTKLFPNSLKVTTSAQEWCGHTFTQLNLRNKEYSIEGKSYFEAEAQEDFKLPQHWLEDELWNRIRINPKTLPIGEVSMIPSTQIARFRHKKLAVELAQASLDSVDVLTQKYVVTYPDRKLSINFDRKFPYGINGWEETYKNGDKELTTKATKKKTLITDYWTKNKPEFEMLRDSLGLN